MFEKYLALQISTIDMVYMVDLIYHALNGSKQLKHSKALLLEVFRYPIL